MPLPHYDRVVFGKAPLRLVIGQIRFPLLFRFNEKPFLAALQEALHSDYPRVGQEHQVALKFSGNGVEPTGETLWRFSDRGEGWSVLLGESALTLESRRYTTVDDFLRRFERVIEAAVTHLGLEDRARLGLRFINEFRSPEATTLADWSGLLNPRFVGFGGARELLEGDVEQAFNELQVRRGDGTLVVRHGLLTRSTVDLRPAEPPRAGPFYLLDLDYFDAREVSLDVAASIATMREYNEVMYQFFRWALDKGSLYQQLDPKP